MKCSLEFCFDLGLIGATLSLNLISIRANYRGKGHSCTESIALFRMDWCPIILILLHRDRSEDKNELPKHSVSSFCLNQ